MDDANKEEGKKKDAISTLVIKLHPDQLQKSYQEVIEILKQAKIFEEEGKEESARDAYFHAAQFIENLKRDFQWGVENKRLALERERAEFEKLARIIPSSSTLDDLFSMITNGLQGRMKGFYEGPEKDAWNKKKEEEREKHRQTYNLLKRNLNFDETANVIDKLRGLEWLTLEYHKDFPLSLEQRENIKGVLSNQEAALNGLLKTILMEQYNIPQNVLISHNLKLGINFYEDPHSIALITEKETFDIMSKKDVRIKLNFGNKQGSEIIEFGFTYANAFDPEIRWIMGPYDLLKLEQGKEGYEFEVYNPKYEDKWGLMIGSIEPELAEKADRRAKEIVERLGKAI